MTTLPPNRVYANGLPPETKEQDVIQLFKPYDNVTDVHIGINPWDGSCRGYVHATCTSVYAASQCIQSLNNTRYKGNTLTLELAKPRYYEIQQEKQLQFSAKQRGTVAPPLQRVPYSESINRKRQVPPPASTPITASKSAAQSDSSSSSSDSDSSSDEKPVAPAITAKPVKRKVIVKKIIRRSDGTSTIVREVREVEQEPTPQVKAAPPVNKAPAKAVSTPAPTSAPAPPSAPATVPAAPAPAPSPAPATVPAPVPVVPVAAMPPAVEVKAEPPKKKIKIIKKVVKKPASGGASQPAAESVAPPPTPTTSNGTPSGNEPKAESSPAAAVTDAGPAGKLSGGLATAWDSFLERLATQGLSEEVILACSQAEFEETLADLGISGLQKISLRSCFLQKKG